MSSSPWSDIDSFARRAAAVREAIRVHLMETLGETAARSLEVDAYGRWCFTFKQQAYRARSDEQLRELASRLARGEVGLVCPGEAMVRGHWA